jgi:glutathione S-transferase
MSAMIQIYRYLPAWGQADISPFCRKVLAYLDFRGLPYQALTVAPSQSPTGKLPCAVIDGQVVADSSDILAALEQRHPQPLDADLSPAQRALSRAIQSLLEDDLYFVLVWLRWVDDAGWAQYRPVIRQYLQTVKVPGWVSGFVADRIRASVAQSLRMQGMGRRRPEDIVARGVALVDAFHTLLGEGPCVLGERVHLIDFSALALIDGLMSPAFDDAVARHARSLPRLVAYAAHMNLQRQSGD